MARIFLQHMSLEFRLAEHGSSAAVYLCWCPRHTGYSVMATPFLLAVLLFPLLGSTFLCPPHSLLAQMLVPPPLDLCGPFGNVTAQHGKHSYCLLSTNHVLSLEPHVCNTNCPAFPPPLSHHSCDMVTSSVKSVTWRPGTQQALDKQVPLLD